MEQKKCPKCGQLINEEEKSCSNCGYSFEENENIEPKTVEQEKTKDSAEKVNSEENIEQECSEETEIVNITEKDNLKKPKLSKSTIILGIMLILSVIVNCILISDYNNTVNDYNDLVDDYKSLYSELSEAQQQVAELTSENEELKNGASKQLVDVKNAFEKGEWQNTIDLANQLHEKYNGTEEDKQAQEMAKQSQAKLDEEAAAKAAEEAKGYETGITYDQLARTPDEYEGKKVKFSGKVVQVMESDDSVTIRLAVNDNYDTILYGQYSSSIVSSRVLEDDHITVYGTSVGTISYQSTMGGTITIPGVYIEKIDQ